jgi:hypothetical protein
MAIFNGLAILGNTILAVLFLSLGVRILAQAVEQIQSGYSPPYMPLVIGLGMVPLVLAATIAAGVILWLRFGRMWLALLADCVATLVAWTILQPLFFLPGDWFLVAWLLAPACIALSSWIVLRDRASSRP